MNSLENRHFDLHYMKIALKQAQKAAALGEVPVGAVLVQADKDSGQQRIVSYGYNKRELKKNALLHAELTAINKACKRLGGWRLPRCTLYVTMEPCPMCAGAIINARVDRVVFGTYDPKFGACGSIVNLFDYPFNHIPDMVGGVLQEDCAKLIKDFFKQLRLSKK